MKALMIGAHQDDNEFRCGGLAAILKPDERWRRTSHPVDRGDDSAASKGIGCGRGAAGYPV